MSNQLRKGAEWAQKMRHLHHTEEITVGGVSLLATTPATETEVERNGVKLATKFSAFIVRNQDITDVPIRRGVEIVWGTKTYEVTNEGGHTHYFNDPFELDVVIMTVKR